MKIKSEFVNDDWERLYINDKLIYENHSISLREFMREVDGKYGIECEETEVEEEC